jgi:hypothetical protein
MAEEEQDVERRLRVGAIIQQLQQATAEQRIGDAQAAFGNTIALMALSTPDPEVTLLTTLEVISEIYRGMREHVRQGKKPEVIN